MDEAKQLTEEQKSEIKKQLQALQKANPKLKRIIPIVVFGEEYDDKPIYVGFFKQPGFVTFSKFMNIVQKDTVGATKELAKDCFVGGDDELVKDDSLFLFGLMPQMQVVTESRQANIVNL